MPRILVVYHSRTGNTKAMAEAVAEGVRNEGVEVTLKNVIEASPEDMLNHDGIIIGTPTYFGAPSAEIKKLIDNSVKYYGDLEGKVGAAFASCGVLGGGAETAALDIIKAFLIHGMIVQGITNGAHYGPISVGKPNALILSECKELGKKVARLVKKLF
ncbi:MAG: NAD(P)H-dependent oxidoreductase [Synergistetes bacterium]|nr:NAD(P)H-dependent oxidoreductase [Synergistota bacterium]MCX8127243.1 NAD(P)H-dependent oxidoreductase [Synergistota bacterium]MDW8191871.1 NAD(P)H-dependent oxidoreductase [Synergistota bacterium]